MSIVVSDDQALQYIAANVARLRGDRSYSELAKLVDSYPANISKIEKGEHMPGAALLSRLAEALGVTSDDLLQPPPSPKKNSRRAG